ncbi:MAG: hypothetical protein AUK44_03260 [Porphyromonadaceae bacterium CG2_30_38_12]|nr:MAG: hypothetical protein AUK44_03260 [Porphyromonadaceae bacterium CG2_30_38_12]
MIALAWIIFSFALIQCVVAAINMLFRPSFNTLIDKDQQALVSVLIPARNEATHIMSLLVELQHQQYQNLEILVYDDASTDNTADLVSAMAWHDKRIQLFGSQRLPDGWLGKNHACFQLSKHAKGNYMLFLDADVRLDSTFIMRLIPYFNKHNLKLLSIFPRQLIGSVGEAFVVPIMNYILLSLLPLFLVRASKRPSLSAANGQCMLFEANTYRAINPHFVFRAEKVEDIRIAAYYKIQKQKMACLGGNAYISCRMYDSYKASVSGFSKNIIMFFGNSKLLAILFWLITSVGFVVVLAALGMHYFLWFLVISLLTRIFVSVAAYQSVPKNLIFLIPQQLSMGYVIWKALNAHKKGGFEWKNRKIN